MVHREGDPKKAWTEYDALKVLVSEIWMARRVWVHANIDILAGVTDFNIRRANLRKAIKDHRLRDIVVGKNKSKEPITYEQAFKKLYLEDLEQAVDHFRNPSGGGIAEQDEQPLDPPL